MSVSASTPAELAAACRGGDRRAASRLITLLESCDPAIVTEASRAVSGFELPRHTIGLTGPPGAGKSTLLDYAVNLFRARNERVAVLAIDPSSPFTGGALLGDRIRMASLRNDTGVFIRSMGSHGASGGMAIAASDALRVLGAAGYGVVFLETVGAGQAETEVVNLADTVWVVQVPGLGDDVQLMKMGILEIADVFIVNKADKPEAEHLKLQIEAALQTSLEPSCRALRQLGKAFAKTYSGPRWTPPVLLVSALKHTGGEKLIEETVRHREFLREPALAAPMKRYRMAHEIAWRAGVQFQARLLDQFAPGGAHAELLDGCVSGAVTLEAAVARVVKA
jgi:LAO/AO transport system kinase